MNLKDKFLKCGAVTYFNHNVREPWLAAFNPIEITQEDLNLMQQKYQHLWSNRKVTVPELGIVEVDEAFTLDSKCGFCVIVFRRDGQLMAQRPTMLSFV